MEEGIALKVTAWRDVSFGCLLKSYKASLYYYLLRNIRENEVFHAVNFTGNF